METPANSSCSAEPPDPAVVHGELDRLFASSHFKNSKRCQSLLRYVVEEALAGRREQLKERSIGVDVFGRDPVYDTTVDPVVRNAVIEVRKRLAQSYMHPGARRIRIDLPAGSYVPEFVADGAHAGLAAVPPGSAGAFLRGPLSRWIAGALAVGALAIAASWTMAGRPSDFDRFWEPVLAGRDAVQVCVGQPTRLYTFQGAHSDDLNQKMASLDLGARDSRDAAAQEALKNSPLSLADLRRVANRYVFLHDAIGMVEVCSFLRSRSRNYRLRAGQTVYGDLRRSPVIAIGADNNPWTGRLTTGLRFGFTFGMANGRTQRYVMDALHPGMTSWAVPLPVSTGLIANDYAIITRMLASATESTVVSIAGMHDAGTLAACEFITEPSYLTAALRDAPRNWSRKNIQIVIETKVIDGTPGPAAAVATHFW